MLSRAFCMLQLRSRWQCAACQDHGKQGSSQQARAEPPNAFTSSQHKLAMRRFPCMHASLGLVPSCLVHLEADEPGLGSGARQTGHDKLHSTCHAMLHRLCSWRSVCKHIQDLSAPGGR